MMSSDLKLVIRASCRVLHAEALDVLALFVFGFGGSKNGEIRGLDESLRYDVNAEKQQQ
jgi:hypothetical protein